jgi:T3SS negative regulator,GrlR
VKEDRIMLVRGDTCRKCGTRSATSGDDVSNGERMQQVEALYVAEFGDVAGVGSWNGGVVVLETNRIFGGDSGYYYIGTFSIFGDCIEASARITKHNPSWANAFGDDATEFEIRVFGRIEGETIRANMERLDRPGFSLPLRLTRKAPLP